MRVLLGRGRGHLWKGTPLADDLKSTFQLTFQPTLGDELLLRLGACDRITRNRGESDILGAGGDVVDELMELELVLHPQHPTLDDDRFGDQVRAPTGAIKEDVGGVSLRSTPEQGKRGGLPEIIVALGTSGAIGAFVAVLKPWIDRDKARKISIKVRTKGAAREVEITADAANIGELEKLLVAAATKSSP